MNLFQVKRFRAFIYFPIALLIAAIGISRLYFGVHWLTDIVGGCLLSAALIMLITLSYNRKIEKNNTRASSVILTVFLTLFITYSFAIFHSYNKLKHDYTMLEWPIYTITFDSWWQQKGNYFPLYRVNRFGLSVNVFNIQWVGNLTQIKESLQDNGWSFPEHDWLSALYRITSVQSTEHLPLVSPIYIDKRPILILIKTMPDTNKLIILRFWASPFLINNVQEPLWLGTIEYAPSTYSWLFKNKKNNDLIPTTSLLFTALPKEYTIKEMTVTIKTKSNRHTRNQNILLIKPKDLPVSPLSFEFPQYQPDEKSSLARPPYEIYTGNSINLFGWEEYNLFG
jgi:LssY-like putative type I secretion system component LssY/PAP2 superfamily protein